MSEKDEKVANALRVLVGEPVRPIRPRWWHAYGRVRDDLGGCHQLTVICESPTPPEDAREMGAEVWGPWLTSWDHEPSDEEREAAVPEEYRDDPDEDELAKRGALSDDDEDVW